MPDARLGVLWHLHQPDYRDPVTGQPTLPWVRMHALRGYRDLFVELAEEGVAMTVNVVPSLLDQLVHYAEGGTDDHLALTVKPAAELTPVEAERAARELPGGHDAMARPHPAWWALKRRALAGQDLSVADLRDVQVWSVLQWFGATACRDHGAIGALRAKAHGFTEADKHVLLDVQADVLADLPGRLAAFVAADGPALSTSPYFHPILPLVVDARHARRCMPDLPDEVDFAWPADALRQLVDARARVEALTGIAPAGLWPSEGSVSPEVVALAAEAGFRWLATDGDVLALSERSGPARPGGWDLGHGVVGFFRDHDLSDRVGFHYAGRPAADAVAELVGVARERSGGDVLTIALDGENPWESFEDAGGAFRQELYRALDRGPVRAVTLDEAAGGPVVGRVHRVHTGSWIRADFHIWIGHPADRAAWRMLARVRRAVATAPAARAEAAMPHVLAAEGSDWTWWYGDDFETRYARHFDALFRAHVAAAWDALGRAVPADVREPIGQAGPLVPPTGFVTPNLHGAPAWQDWVGAGRLTFPEGAMARGGRRVRDVRFGWDPDLRLWLAITLAGSGGDVDVDVALGARRAAVADRAGARAATDGVDLVHLGDTVLVRAPQLARATVRVGFGDTTWGPAEVRRPADPALAWWSV